MDNNTRMFITSGEEDRISNLPEHLIDSILEWLPLQDVVRTSILSKNWRYRWRSMRALVVDGHLSKKLATNGAFGQNGFIRTINRILLLHTGPISKFHLHIPNMILDSFQEVDQWLLLLSTKGVKELFLANANKKYKLPPGFFSCLELRKLTLKNYIINTPIQFEGFVNLENLYLKSIEFTANLGGTVINLPQLKVLCLNMCTNVYKFNIKATNLQTLFVIDCPGARLLQLLHSQCLAWVTLRVPKPIDDSVQVERMNLGKMLATMPKILYISLNGHFLKFCIAEKPKWLPNMLTSLKYLWLENLGLNDLDQLQGALCLLRNSPNLERVTMLLVHTPQLMDHGEGSASHHLEEPDCLDQTWNQLRSVRLSPLHGSKPELIIIKLLLAHSPSLEKFTTQPSGAFDANTRLNIARNLMCFPRASPRAKMIYQDPR